MQWEGFREAVDDTRYFTTLMGKIDDVMEGTDEALKHVAKSATAWWNGLSINGDLGPIRSKMIQYNLRLSGQSDVFKVVYWQFDDVNGSSTAQDSSGGNNTGTLVNMNPSTAWVDGKAGGGLYFNRASQQYVNCGNDSELNITDAITVMAWVKPTSTIAQVIRSCGRNGSKFRINVNPDINLWVRTDNEGWHFGGVGTPHTWTDGWHHIAWTYDSATNMTKFYFDGNLDYTSTTISTGPMTSDDLSSLLIGGSENGKYFDGDMDEVKVYNRALSINEISTIYNSER
ncbi:MAG: LamG domain-containing protein [bacterium]|nr:LamG domain-containing protein [bacterium]